MENIASARGGGGGRGGRGREQVVLLMSAELPFLKMDICLEKIFSSVQVVFYNKPSWYIT